MKSFLDLLEELQAEVLIDDWNNVWTIKNSFMLVIAERSFGNTVQVWDEQMLESNPPPPGLRPIS